MLRTLIGFQQKFNLHFPFNRFLRYGIVETDHGQARYAGKSFDDLDLSWKKFSTNFDQQFLNQQSNDRELGAMRKSKLNTETQNGWNISSWTVVIVGLLAFALIQKAAQAEEDVEDQEVEDLTNSKTKVVTKENFQSIITQLNKNVVFINSLELDCKLSESELKILYDAIKNNTQLGYITWHKDQITYQTLEKIEKRLVENNKNYRYYPNDYTHALLSKHAYKTSNVGDITSLDHNVDEYLKNWTVLRVFDDTKVTGYYGAIYINDKTHQVVLANRGTEEVLKGLFNKNSDWKTNFEEILGGQIIVGQQAKNLMATAEAIEIAKQTGYSLSFTGHSLGAWLAEMSAFYSHAFFDFRKVKAVTFDSPGTVPMMENLQSNIRSKENVKLEDVEIVTYLAGPNPANCCNPHVGKVYRVVPKMHLTEKIESKLPKFIMDNLGDKIRGLFSVEGHFMNGLSETFDPETGKPKECKRMMDWPRVEYQGNNSFSSRGKGIAKKGIESSTLSPMVQTGLNMALDHVIGDRTIMTIVGFLKTYIQGGIEADQYWAYFKHIDLENGEQKKELIFNNRFALFTLAKYREGKDIHTLKLSTGSTDKYLYKLFCFKEKLKENEDLPLILKLQLKELLDSYKIVRNGEDYVLVPTPGHDVESIRTRTQRLLNVIPQDLRKVWQNIVVKKFKIENARETKEIKKVTDNLMQLTAYYVSISDKETDLKKQLERENRVVVCGLGGMGKSTLAAKQGKECKQQGWQVRWLKSTQLDEEFFQLARELKIKTTNLSPNEVRDLVYKEFEKIGKEKPVLLIFDNVDDRKKIAQYLTNQPSCVKVIITSRDANILNNIKPIQMNGFNKEQAITYIKDALGKKEETAEKLVNTVGLSPFRLSKAVAYLWTHDLMSINEYIKIYNAIKKGQNQNEEIYPEMTMLFRDLKTEAPVSWQLLQYMAYLDPEGVPLEFIMKVMGQTKEELQQTVNELKKSSLINVVSEGDKIELKVNHRIVQEETKKALIQEDKEQIKVVLEKLYSELYRVLDYSYEKKSDLSRKEVLELIPHAKILINEARSAGIFSGASRLMGDMGLYYYEILHDHKEAIRYWEELVKDQKLLDSAPEPQLFKASTLNLLGNAYVNLKGKENASQALKHCTEALAIFQKQGNNEGIAYTYGLIGILYANFHDRNSEQLSLQHHKESLQMFRKLYPKGHNDLAESLYRVGLAYSAIIESNVNASTEEEKRLAVKYIEEALIMHQNIDSKNKSRTGELLNFLAHAYGVFGDRDKAVEYHKQAYAIALTDLESDHEIADFSKDLIQKNQRNFFARKGESKDCFGGFAVGNECRFLISTRGETDENLLKIKQTIQKSVLSHIINIVDDEAWVHKRGWSSNSWLVGGDWGVKGYLEKDYLKRELKELGNNDENIELAQMLCFESTNLAIMKSEKKAYEVVQSFARENPELVKKIAVQHPEFFVDGSIVQACIDARPEDKQFREHLLKHVKYLKNS